MVTSDDLSLLTRSLESIERVTSGSGLHLYASVADPSEEILSLLESHSFNIHSFGAAKTKPMSWLGRILPDLSIAEDIREMARKLFHGGVCQQDPLSPEIKILHTGDNTTKISTFRPTLANLTQQEREATYINHPYNPMFRRAVMNSKGSEGGEGGEACKEAEQLKAALKHILSALPDLKYLLMVESGLYLHPDFVSFFAQTLPAMQQDPSLYCISASNPLALPAHPGDLARLHRLDHFTGGASMVPRSLVEEVAGEFVVYEQMMEDADGWGVGGRSGRTGMEWLTEWLSWWGRRYRRGCVVPDVPRVCPLLPPSDPAPALPETCARLREESEQSPPRNAPPFDISKLVHYKYSQELFSDIESAQSLGTKVLNCTDPDFFPQPMNHSSYVIFIKMENYDDDFTFHHVMECFGLDLPGAVGYFEGVFQVTFRGKRVFILGAPYSRFSPGMKESDNLIIADIKSLFVRGQTNYMRHRRDKFIFNTVLVLHSMP